MPVHPVFREMIDQAGPQQAANATPLTIQEQRKAADGMVAGLMAFSEEGPEVADVRDRVVPGPHGDFPVRVYTPEGTGPFPVYVYFHGGGWWMGNIAMTDGECRHVARGAACVVVSIEYHLAPENKFPIPLEDCYAATTWVVEHAAELAVDPERVAVGGGSSGAMEENAEGYMLTKEAMQQFWITTSADRTTRGMPTPRRPLPKT
ncbi:MAG: alpha/beta hydrolase [Gemmatimonadales bacterium]